MITPGRQDALRPVAARPHDARGRQARVRRADGAPARDRPAAHRHHGAGRERDRQLRHPARFLARRAAPVRASRSRPSWRAWLGKNGTWSQVFGATADQAFNAWYIARYVDEVAAAGKAELNLPMYVNASLSDPFTQEGAQYGASGGPNWNVIDIWKAAAPHIDICSRPTSTTATTRTIAKLARSLSPARQSAVRSGDRQRRRRIARFFWPALGNGAIGWAPFGMDATGYFNYPLGAKQLDAETLEAFASKFACSRRSPATGRGSPSSIRRRRRQGRRTVPTRQQFSAAGR